MIGQAGIQLATADAELRAPRIPVMVVVQAFAAGQPRDQSDVRGRIAEVPVAAIVASPLIEADRRRRT